MVRVTVTEGILEGEVQHNKYTGKLFNSFKGIPYAQPPIGDLRFKAPQLPKPWTGVREAKECGNNCYQFDSFFNKKNIGSEDCLYLNVYTPTLKPNKPLPVMFWIHGGAFVAGSGDDSFYGPQFLVNKDVVLVTINYRLEVLGFLSLNTEDIPGNAGMKDQVAALRWTHKNITSFGGDPNNITIFGESAGGGSVSYHCISPMSKGYFKRAIIMSGASNSYWAQAWKPRERAMALARRLGCYSEDDKELYEFFKNQPVENLTQAQAPILLSEKTPSKIECFFSIVDEQKFGDNERFFYGDMFDVLSTKIHEGIDIMIGWTSDEGFVNIGREPDSYKEKLNLVRNFPEVLLSKPLSLDLTINQQLEFGARMRKFYFKDKIKDEDWDKLANFYAMDLFLYPIMQWVKAAAKTTKNNLYVYEFSCVSERNMAAALLGGLAGLLKGKPVCCHGDDIMYLFHNTFTPANISSGAMGKIERATKLWTNFAKSGNPTPDDSVGAKWLPFTINSPNYLNVGNELMAGSSPRKEEQEFWTNLHKEFGQKVFE